MKEVKNKYNLTATKDGDLASTFVSLSFFFVNILNKLVFCFLCRKSRNKLRKRRNGKENSERSGEASCIKGGRNDEN